MSSTAMNDREATLNKMNTPPISHPSLPDDLLVSCFARVSNLHYPTLSLVSKRFCSLLASPDLDQTRSLLGRSTESYLYVYVCLKFPLNPNPCWFTLCKKPNQFLTKKTKKKKGRSSCHVLVPIPSPESRYGGVVTIGSSIYSIGGQRLIDHEPSSSVSVLDCRSHTWHQAPNMSVARCSARAHVIDGKIYVVGGHPLKGYSCGRISLIEVFHPKTQTWKILSSPSPNLEINGSTKIDGKICIFYCDGKGVAYNPKNGTCEPLEREMCKGLGYYSYCVIDNVLFSYYYFDKVFKWFDTKARLWRDLKGLEAIMCRMGKKSYAILADYGGKMVVLWDRQVPSRDKLIWCAVVAVERRNSSEEEEIWGTVEWFGVVLKVPTTCHFEHVLATTL